MCSLQCFSTTAISFRTQKYVNSPHVHRLSPIGTRNFTLALRATTSIDEIPPNAVRRETDQNWRGGFSLGVDLGLSRTGIAISKGYSVKPLTVLKSRGQKLETRLLEIAEEEEVDEFIIGLPRSSDGKETIQSNKIRSVAGRLAVQAAERGWRVYVFDEHGTTSEASDRMIVMGLSKSERQSRSDAYAAVILLERYFSTQGLGAEIILPKSLELQEKLKNGASVDPDFNPDKLEEYYTF
ncbi:PREDICTED: uncharacterized protein LOC104771153 [Camelina sativa]|uniref:Uncharacterized protein LOC104771153 n=1 Tax=Camelina sativa TaxID=90675 RepID=A0ABM0Y190_CAMSA|nr:PREDICTED: uncharacterized protein LOC104771153 [Camelina sativa]XP_010493939.1 PREDICTED: uncharacterized protein LOC104771153 [Camelina sativa]XP_019098959.1 PREDICTED: uncharacterized protein LOC104771153 [Camelina sativa]